MRDMSLFTQYLILVGQFKILLTLVELGNFMPLNTASSWGVIGLMLQLSIVYQQFRKCLLLLAYHS
jgi:hypothetical protein